MITWKKCRNGLKVKLKTIEEMRVEPNYTELRTLSNHVLFMQNQNRQVVWEENLYTPSVGFVVRVDKPNHVLYVNFNGNTISVRPQVLKEEK